MNKMIWMVLVLVVKWMMKLMTHVEKSDSMTGRVDRFTNTTKLTIYKSREASGNY